MFGAGAVGSVLAARLSAAGHGVTVIARASHAAAIRERGLTIEGVSPGRFPLDARDTLQGVETPDALLLTVKTFDLPVAARSIFRAFPRLPPVLLPQNGLDVETTVRPELGHHDARDPPAVVRAVQSIPVTYLGPGYVRQVGEGRILLAAQPPARLAEATAVFRDLLRGAGFEVTEVSDLGREVWRKALLNAAVNPVTADHGVVNGRLAREPWRSQALELLREARESAALDGVEFPFEEVEADFLRVVRATAENRSSMLQDLERGRPTEIDAISGAILAKAAGHGVDLPATRRAVDRIREHVRRRDRLLPPQAS